MTSLRARLVAVFLAATLVPLAVTVWITLTLLEHSLTLASTHELDDLSRSAEVAGRSLYQRTRDSLRQSVESGTRKATAQYPLTSDAVRDFVESGEESHFELAGPGGDRLRYYVKRGNAVDIYEEPLGAALKDLRQQHTRARALVERASKRDFRRGYLFTWITIAAAVWVLALVVLIFLALRITRPIRQLTRGLRELAAGNLDARLEARSTDEVGLAMSAFNDTADELRHSQERVIHLAKVASWQTLARKMAHEVKNSLTPIRLTVEEMASRRFENDPAFIEQAAQIVADEVTTLERRVRSFSEFAAEPAVRIRAVDVNALLRERIAFLETCHPEVAYNTSLEENLTALADEDLIKGVLTNLLENAAHAAGGGGVVLGRTYKREDKVAIEVHDSGSGLSPLARSTLFEPTISFKKSGMGLGLSIARRSAVLSGGEIYLVNGELGGAAFRVLLPAASV